MNLDTTNFKRNKTPDQAYTPPAGNETYTRWQNEGGVVYAAVQDGYLVFPLNVVQRCFRGYLVTDTSY